MAEAIFNTLVSEENVAISAGINPGTYEGKRVGEVGPLVTRCMKEIGIDISDKISKKLTKDMFDSANVVVSMVDELMLPEYVRISGKVRYWEINNPVNMGYEGHIRVRDKINGKVKRLVEEIERNQDD